ncbi:hypothetical protein, partial [Prevotella pallens]|uniref:hypothetical protein n=1 Tax=Prevotella pallens TaxID=60133 RepID=UPI0023F3A10E
YARWCERTGVNHPLLLDLLCGILSVFDGNPGKSLVPVIRVIILGMENWYDTKDRVERRDREGIIL